MKKFFIKLKNIILNVFSKLKAIFFGIVETTNEHVDEGSDFTQDSDWESDSDNQVVITDDSSDVNGSDGGSDLFESDNVEPEPEFVEDTDNEPFDKNHVKRGELGGYVLYDKTKAKIDAAFVANVEKLGVEILYINTPREKSRPGTFLQFNDWWEIFETFRNSNIKIMLYVYETLSSKDSETNFIYRVGWSDDQKKRIAKHPSFYGWIGEDEVSNTTINGSHKWITQFHAQKWSDGTRKWPNLSVCYFPKVERLMKINAIGKTPEEYMDYLEKWAPHIDIALSDMYPIKNTTKNGAHYNINEDGVEVWSNVSGGEYWYGYLRDHLEFINNHPELVHRFYLHTCKHVAKDDNGKLYIAKSKPTHLSLSAQSYANLMAGSNGLMFFLFSDIVTYDENGNALGGFTEAAFNDKFEMNPSTYNMMEEFYTSEKFKNYKNIMVNLHPDSIDAYKNETIREDDGFIKSISENGEVLVGIAHNEKYEYCTILNLSLTEKVTVVLKDGSYIMNLENSTITNSHEEKEYEIEPCDIMMIKRPII